MSRGCQRRCRALPQLWENGSDEGGPLIDAQVTGTTAHRGVGKKNERRRRCLNLNAGEGGALTPGGGHSALGGVGRKAATCFGAREKHGRGKGRRGARATAKSGAEREQGWGLAPQPRGGGEGGSDRRGTLTSRAPQPVAAWARWRRQRSGARHRAEERREEGGLRSAGPHLEERGGAWATPGTRGPAEEKEKRAGPKGTGGFSIYSNKFQLVPKFFDQRMDLPSSKISK
jgi:hypothetical protein